jgi:hypothetical protein
MEKYGNLGKLIDQEQYYLPTFVMEDYQAMGFSEEQADKMNLERFREHTKKLTKMEEDRPKLYGLMMKHMSVESRMRSLRSQITMYGMPRKTPRSYGRQLSEHTKLIVLAM